MKYLVLALMLIMPAIASADCKDILSSNVIFYTTPLNVFVNGKLVGEVKESPAYTREGKTRSTQREMDIRERIADKESKATELGFELVNDEKGYTDYGDYRKRTWQCEDVTLETYFESERFLETYDRHSYKYTWKIEAKSAVLMNLIHVNECIGIEGYKRYCPKPKPLPPFQLSMTHTECMEKHWIMTGFTCADVKSFYAKKRRVEACISRNCKQPLRIRDNKTRSRINQMTNRHNCEEACPEMLFFEEEN